jgi:hypothetical protein
MVTGYLTQLDDNLIEDLAPLGRPYPLAIATRLSDSDMCRTLKYIRRTFRTFRVLSTMGTAL